MRRLLLPFVAVALVAACSDSSGVDGKLVFGSLSDSDWQRYCNWYNGEVSQNAGKSCSDGSLIPSANRDCMAKNPAPNCTATVSQVEDCVHKFKDHSCDGLAKVVATCTGFVPACNGLLAPSSGLN
jgi:hypothetical protein